jgi:hypothetical protein
MGDVPVPGYQTFWTNKRSALKPEYQTLVQQYPDTEAQPKQIFKLLGDIEDVPRHISASAGELRSGLLLLSAAEENGTSYCKALHGKTLFSALCGTYTVTLHKFKAVLKASAIADQSNSPKATGQQIT